MKHYFKLLRPHHWSKNVLILLPPFAGGMLWELDVLLSLLGGILIFSLCASSCYIFNDLLDVENDRKHKRKKHRPIAAGHVSRKNASIVGTILLFSTLASSVLLGWSFFFLALCYFTTSSLYSLFFKKVFILDIIVLVGLYTFRIGAGLLLSPAYPTAWLFTFVGSFFLSLAALKRYTEVRYRRTQKRIRNQKVALPGRGYSTKDGGLLQVTGITSGLVAVGTLVSYVRSDAVINVYNTPGWLILIPICLCVWINRAWILAQRGKMDCDPIVYAWDDSSTYVAATICSLALFLAS